MLFAYLIALAVIALGLYVARKGLKDRRHAHASRAWPTVSGRVETQTVDEVTERDSEGDLVTTYYVRPSYAYEHAGQPFVSDRIHHAGHETSSRKRAQRWQEAYAAGREVTVYVNPDDPAYAVLEPTGEGGYMISVVGGLVMAGAGLMMILATMG